MICLVVECPRPRLQRKTPLCRLHYNRLRQGVALDAPVRPHRTKAETAAGVAAGTLQRYIDAPPKRHHFSMLGGKAL
jgi:hypothetical protein